MYTKIYYHYQYYRKIVSTSPWQKFNNTFEKLVQVLQILNVRRLYSAVNQEDERFLSHIYHICTTIYTAICRWIKEVDLENEGKQGEMLGRQAGR